MFLTDLKIEENVEKKRTHFLYYIEDVQFNTFQVKTCDIRFCFSLSKVWMNVLYIYVNLPLHFCIWNFTNHENTFLATYRCLTLSLRPLAVSLSQNLNPHRTYAWMRNFYWLSHYNPAIYSPQEGMKWKWQEALSIGPWELQGQNRKWCPRAPQWRSDPGCLNLIYTSFLSFMLIVSCIRVLNERRTHQGPIY